MKRVLTVIFAEVLLLTLASTTVSGQLQEKLIEAARNSQADVVRDLLYKGAEVNVKDNDGTTALMWVSRNRQADVVKLLNIAGAK